MIFSLTVSSLIRPGKGGKARPGTVAGVDLLDLPRYVQETLGLHGLNLTAGVLAGRDRGFLGSLRDQADKAGCACLLLVEEEPQAFGAASEKAAQAALERTAKVLEAAHLLGCNSAAVPVEAADDEESFELVGERLKRLMDRAERLEMNLLISPRKGLTADPVRLTELIKRVGGFRIGTYPDFQTAALSSDEPDLYLRRLVPYASAVSASTVGFESESESDDDEVFEAAPAHLGPDQGGYDLRPMVEAVLAVGYDGALAIDYRGEGDGTLGVLHSRAALEAAIEAVAEG